MPVYLGCQSPRLLESIGGWEIGGLPLLTPPSYAATAFDLIKKGADEVKARVREDDLIASVLVSLSEDENSATETFAHFITSVIRHLSAHQLQTCGLTTKDVKEIIMTYHDQGWEALPSRVYDLGAVGVERCIAVSNQIVRSGTKRIKKGSPLGPNKENAIRILSKEIIPLIGDLD